MSSREPQEHYYHYPAFIESLRRFGEVPTNIGHGREWKGLHTKPYLLREWLRSGGNTSDRLIVSDAWDVILTQHPHGIGDRIAEYAPDAIVFNGEAGCWPRSDLAESFPDDGNRSRFLNSGFFCGKAERILELLEVMDIDGIGFDRRNSDDSDWIFPNDQGTYQELYSRQNEHGIQMIVDTGCVWAQTLSAGGLEDFDFSGEPSEWSNKVTGTTPGVWHGNGPGKNLIMPTIFLKFWPEYARQVIVKLKKIAVEQPQNEGVQNDLSHWLTAENAATT